MTIPPKQQTIDTIVEQTLSVVDMMEKISPGDTRAFDIYRKNCHQIPKSIESGLIRIAVVGVIKSGKSTFINSLTGKELVKRGAGVVTSITTRIRKGKKNEAILVMKSWDEVNAIIRKTLELFPVDGPDDSSDNGPGAGFMDAFDLRRKKDRAYLGRVYDRLIKEFPVTNDGIRPETVLIKNVLEGYEACKDIVGADQGKISFSSKSFEKHKAFTANPAMACYVKDVCLNVFGKAIEPNLEIADCQGADSTDPAQLSQIVTYLESANLIVYCISSRIGLRQSDMTFLKMIKRMGLMDNVLFVNNCDLTEHENLADLVHLESKICHELELLTPNPSLHTFSALYTLFQAMGSRLPQRDAKRLKFWQEDQKMIGYCNENWLAFHQTLEQLLEKNRYDLLLSNPLERIRIMVGELDKKADIFDSLFSSDMDGEKQNRVHLKEISENAARLKSIVDNSIEGAVSGLVKEIQLNLEKAFARDSIHIGKQVHDFIQQTPLDADPYRSQIKEGGLNKILYLMFQDFKRKIDLFALEQILPELKNLIQTQETRISAYFQSLLDSYQIDFLKLSNTTANTMGGEPKISFKQLGQKDTGSLGAVDIQGIKKILGLTLPDIIFTARYTPRIRATAMTGLGVQSIVQLISSLLDKHLRFSFTPGFDRAAQRIKRASLFSIQQQIDQYHDQLIRLYFMPLIDAVTRDFTEKIHQRFTLYESLNEEMEILFSLKQNEKKIQQEKISTIKNKTALIISGLNTLSRAPQKGVAK